MVRVKAADYDGKRLAILKRSAKLFAASGFERTSMAEIAIACGTSKGLLYHYYINKEALLFDIIESHLIELVEAVEAADDSKLPPEKRLRLIIGALLDAYRDADHEHKIQIHDLAALPDERQQVLRTLERQLVAQFAEVISLAKPELSGTPHLLKPLTMSLFGMLNWHYMWFRADGPLSREDYADMVTGLVLGRN